MDGGQDSRSQGRFNIYRGLSSLYLYTYLHIEKHTNMYIHLCMYYVIIGVMTEENTDFRVGAQML